MHAHCSRGCMLHIATEHGPLPSGWRGRTEEEGVEEEEAGGGEGLGDRGLMSPKGAICP